MRVPFLLSAGLSLILLASCASIAPTGASVTYDTVPEGAMLYEGSTQLGVAPQTRNYAGDGKSQITTPDVTAVWPSGAKASFYTILQPGDDRNASIVRPANAPNLQVDLANAEKVKAQLAAEAERKKAADRAEINRNSARCQAQITGTGAVKAPVDDCK